MCLSRRDAFVFLAPRDGRPWLPLAHDIKDREDFSLPISLKASTRAYIGGIIYDSAGLRAVSSASWVFTNLDYIVLFLSMCSASFGMGTVADGQRLYLSVRALTSGALWLRHARVRWRYLGMTPEQWGAVVMAVLPFSRAPAQASL